MSLSNIIIGANFDFGFGTEGDDRLIYNEIPITQITELQNSSGIDAILLSLGMTLLKTMMRVEFILAIKETTPFLEMRDRIRSLPVEMMT